nr:SMR family transporter [Rhodococcus sp. (in: high G+C Gram-positive bacteria)]
MAYCLLILAISSEVGATLSLRVAAGGRKIVYCAVLVGYVVAFSSLLAALRQGLPLGVGYGIWVAAGVALTAVLSKYLFSEALNRRMVTGIVLIGAGVLLVEIGAATH